MQLYNNSFIELLQKTVPDKLVLQYKAYNISCGNLLNESYALAQQLSQKGIVKGDRVVFLTEINIDFVKLIYANMMLGTIISIIDPEMGRENFKAKLNQFNPQHAFVDRRLLFINEHPIIKYVLKKVKKDFPFYIKTKNCKVFSIGKKLPVFQKHIPVDIKTLSNSAPLNLMPNNEQDDFLVIYTSGTTNEPKGVVHSYASVSNSLFHLSNLLKSNGDQIIATHLPQFVLLGINAGLKVWLWDNKMSGSKKLEFIIENGITTLFGPPSDYLELMQVCEKSKSAFPLCLKNIYIGSAPVYASFLKKLVVFCQRVKITCLYGMTENLMTCFIDAREKINDKGVGDLVGMPFGNNQITISELDNEIGINSDQKFKYYWNQAPQLGFHFTGDLGRIDDKGRLVLTGRKKDMIIRRHFNIYPGLYEPIINHINGITEAVLIGKYDDGIADEKVYLVVESEIVLTKQFIFDQLTFGKYSIDKEAIPDEIIFMKLLRFGRQNKVDKKAIRAILN
jgi:acyl-CoA synthetase (AMP-forming)/AMP-acid ligase II